jgi:methyl-accepting chemotaxis protein
LSIIRVAGRPGTARQDKQSGRIGRLLHPGDWPIGVKVLTLVVGVSAVLAAALTYIGYQQASASLREQAETSLKADGLLTSQDLDNWAAERRADAAQIAGLPALQRVLLGGVTDAVPQDVATVQEALKAVPAAGTGVSGVQILDKRGFIIINESAAGDLIDISGIPAWGQIKAGNIPPASPLLDAEGKTLIYSLVPMKDATGQFSGAVLSSTTIDRLTASIQSASGRAGKGGHGILLDRDGLVIGNSVSADWQHHPVVSQSPEKLAELKGNSRWGSGAEPFAPLDIPALGNVVGVGEQTLFSFTFGGVEYRALATPAKVTGWTYVTAVPVSTFQAPAQEFLRNALVAAVIALAIGAAIALLFARSIAAAAGRLARAANRLARGEAVERSGARSNDELGRIARAFDEVVDSQRELAATAQAVADGDLTRDVTPRSEHDVLGAAFQQMVGNLRTLVGEVQSNATALAATSAELDGASAQTGSAMQQVTAAVQGITEGAVDTSAAAQNASMAVSELGKEIDGIARGAAGQVHQVTNVSQTAVQLAAGIDQVAGAARLVAETSEQTRAAARHGEQAVRQTIAGMAEIESVVVQAAGKVGELGVLGEQIGAVVETINDVAEQTNLLALNAAIEAARAGEHGRGFAVVADEVRKLAERSQRETRAIADLIAQVQRGTREAVHAMEGGAAQVQAGSAQAGRAGDALAEILAAIETTVAQVGEIAGSAQEMAAGARSVVEGVQSISEVAESNQSATEAMTTRASMVSDAITSIAAVAEENSASGEEVTAAAEATGAQVTAISARARDLARTAEQLEQLVARFRLAAQAGEPTPLRRVA